MAEKQTKPFQETIEQQRRQLNIPVVATLLWSMLFIVLAIWRFSKEEF
jgi:hypothetical protein